MKKRYALLSFLSVIFIFIFSCSKNEEEYVPVSPVTVDLSQVPYNNLSDYHFFDGAIKNMNPSLDVVPYQPASTLFTDYALKKRWIWMPKNTTATYTQDNKILNFPVGTVLIKNFYYDTMQPGNTTKIIETRMMILKADGWQFAEYLWNDAQTEALLVQPADFTNATNVDITFKKPNNAVVSTAYHIPSSGECIACHKINEIATPIGPKPQNLNITYAYPEGNKNQLLKLKQQGYLASYPSTIVSTVDYHDTSKSLDLRMRSYLDINCAHCHQDQGRCSYMYLRFGFSETTDPVNLGICVLGQEPVGPWDNPITKLIFPGVPVKSIVHYRMSSSNESEMMPLIGRTLVHDEGVALLEQYISSLTQVCP